MRSLVITGTDSTPAGQSHSCVRPTRLSRSPSEHTMSVAEGSSETIRNGYTKYLAPCRTK